MKTIRVIFLGEAEKNYFKLIEITNAQKGDGKENTFEIQLLNSIKQKIEFLKANPFYGDNIKKNLIPKEYYLKYNVNNLWRIEITSFWRMLYTIKGDIIEVICFILDIVNHKEYNKKFGYKRKN